MDDDFIFSEGETERPSRRKLLLTGVAFLAALIFCSLCAIGILVIEKQEELLVSLGAQAVLPTGTPTIQSTSTPPPSSPSIPLQTATIVSQAPATTETPTGAHRIVIYVEQRVPFRVISTATPQQPHRIIRYGISTAGGQGE